VANGTPVPGASITRSGIGAERLCAGCHEGERHAGCGTGIAHAGSCHGSNDPAPAGSPCFFCHSHEGIVNIPIAPANCSHCHTEWMGLTEATAPNIYIGPSVEVLGPTRVAITWSTNEAAGSWVDFGTDTLATVVGNRTLVNAHRVELTGLTGNTTYRFRVRSADAMRNEARSEIRTFTTLAAGAPPAPTIIPQGAIYAPNETFNVTLRWGAVVDPESDPVQYRLVVAWDAGFQYVEADTGWITSTQAAVTLSSLSWGYSWHVQARDAVHGLESQWSSPGRFPVYSPWQEE
jgi:hypothetical protein